MMYPNSICQDFGAIIYMRDPKDENRLIHLMPISAEDDYDRIVSWVPSPAQMSGSLQEMTGCYREQKGDNRNRGLLRRIWEWIKRMNDPICQDWSATMFGQYNGHSVLLVPVVDASDISRIAEWVPSPASIQELEKKQSKGSSGDLGNNTCCVRKQSARAVSKDSLIVIDGSNVICKGDENGVRGTHALKALADALIANGYTCRIFVDGSMIGRLQYKEHDDEGVRYLKSGEKTGLIVIAPGRAEADGQILQLAEFEGAAHIITNDQYRDYSEMHPWLLNDGVLNRLHGINIVRINGERSRILVAGFNLDITL